MKIQNINYGLGIVTHNSLCYDENIPLLEQAKYWGEDLIQVEYCRSELVLDIGWKRKNNIGEFVVVLIKKCDWDSPVVDKRSISINDLYNDVVEVVSIANDLESKYLDSNK